MSRAGTAKGRTAPPDRRKIVIYATIAIVLIAILAAVAFYSRQVVPSNATIATGGSKLKVGDKAPEFSVQTDAGQFDLAQVTTPVLLEVFATWCPHCQIETTALNDIAQKYQGKLALVAVSGDAFDMSHTGPESQADVNTFAQQFHVRYPIAFDPNLTVAQQYLKEGFPTLVLIRPDKTIAWINSGQIPEADVVKQINKVVH